MAVVWVSSIFSADFAHSYCLVQPGERVCVSVGIQASQHQKSADAMMMKIFDTPTVCIATPCYKATKVDPCRLGRQRYKTLRFSPAFQLSTERGAGITKGKRAIVAIFVRCACASLYVLPCAFSTYCVCALRFSLFLF